jgi:two-component system cell cycle response regulator
MMPGMDGFETCRRLKADPVTRHIPVVLVTALDGREDKLKGLDAGADDFVTKPIDDVILFARVRSLLRLKSVMDELREREESGRRLGVDTDGAGRLRGSGGRILIVDDNARQVQKMVDHLSAEHRPMVESDPAAAMIAARGPIDLMIVNVSSAEFDGLRFVAQTRSTEAARRIPILAVVDPADRGRLLKALELGVNDILLRPVDSEELEARARTQIKRKRYADFLKQKLDYSLEMAVTDALTGLHNRRYMAGQLQALMSRAGHGGDPVAVLVLDIDHFKLVNDGFGHDAGDEVLREFAVRLATNVRAIDLPCRAAFLIGAMGCGGGDPALGLDRAGAQQYLPMILAGLQREVGGHQDRLRPHLAQRDELLGEAHVVADGQAPFHAAGLDTDQPIPRAIQRAFAITGTVGAGDVEQMDLAVTRDLPPLRIEQQRGVEQLVPCPGAALLDDRAAMDMDAVRACQGAQEFIGLPALPARLGQGLGRAHPRIAPAAEIGPGFGQRDQVRPVRGERGFDQAPRLADIGGLVGALVHLDDGNPHMALSGRAA